MNLYNELPKDVRMMIRNGEYTSPTAGLCGGYAQGNLVILPKELALDFLIFAQRNPKPCPILSVSEVGGRELADVAKGSDITTDIPKYRVYEHGIMTGEYDSVSHLYRDDFVSILLGCSFTFESGLIEDGISVRHIEEGCNVPMFITNIKCKDAGVFKGPTVVSMRPIPSNRIADAVKITSRYPGVHGAPIHIGNPKDIGIVDIMKPDFGDSVTINEGEIPVFWACGVTPQAVAMNVKPSIMITHAPGYMFITDIKNQQLAVI